jgi:hypothetical protein
VDIYLCGILAGLACGYLILSTTFQKTSPLRASSVGMWGFRGPLGAFISAWGGVAMLTSAPFDNWWHDAYGLDVRIISPPHMILATGIMAVHLGALILILGRMNRATGEARQKLLRLYLYIGGMILVSLTVLQMEMVYRTTMHTVHCYHLVALVAPLVFAAVARGSGHRWGATAVAAVYSIFVLLMSWVLPLFPAEPKLGPVYHQLHEFTPPEFPLLLIAPAFVLDLIWQRTAKWGGWVQALVSGTVFVGVFMAVQWPFANFLMSPAARNWFWGAKYFGYYASPRSLYIQYKFLPAETGAALVTEIAWTLAAAILTARLGLAAGNWMLRIKR